MISYTLITSLVILSSVSAITNNDNLIRRLRIEGGSSIKYDQYPFMAELRWYTDSHACGGSIIRKEYPTLILTAAHCLPHGKHAMFVRLGADSHKQTVAENPSIIDSKITNVIIHEDYSGSHADIAILSLESKDIQESPLFRQVQLSSTNTQSWSEPHSLTVIGYGRDKCGGPLTETLESLDLSFKTDANCYHDSHMSSSTLCTYAGDNETPGATHSGDSGSPLFEYQGTDSSDDQVVSEYKQVGLLYGGGCPGIKQLWDVWTDIGSYKSWIETKIVEITKDLCNVGDLSGNCIVDNNGGSYKQYCDSLYDPGYRILETWKTSDCTIANEWETVSSSIESDAVCCPIVNFV